MTAFRTLVAAAAIALAFPMHAAKAEDAAECDRLAGHPFDPQKGALGVALADIDGPAAEAACRAALKASPDDPRLLFQLGRSLAAEDRFTDAIAVFEDAFAKGYAIAAFSIGTIYQENLDEPDYPKAAEWFGKSLDAGFLPAATQLGWLYESGNGVEEDHGKAAALYLQAAEAGDADGQVHLGYLYENGIGVPQNAGLAVRWYRAAADQGNDIGQFDLGLMYASGTGVPRDDAEAARLMRLSADQDYSSAVLELARYARDGTGMPLDVVEAEALFRRAIALDDSDSVVRLAENELAWMWAIGRKNLDEGATLVADALKRMPEDHEDRAAVLDTAAWIAHLRGRDDEALPMMEQAVAAEGDYAPFHDRLGDILAALGRRDEAVASWKRAINLPDPAGDDLWSRAAVYLKISPPGEDSVSGDRGSSEPSISPSR